MIAQPALGVLLHDRVSSLRVASIDFDEQVEQCSGDTDEADRDQV